MKGTVSLVFITSKIEFGKYMYTLEFHLPFHAFRILSPPKSEVEIMFTRCWWSFGGQAFCKSSRADWISSPIYYWPLKLDIWVLFMTISSPDCPISDQKWCDPGWRGTVRNCEPCPCLFSVPEAGLVAQLSNRFFF